MNAESEATQLVQLLQTHPKYKTIEADLPSRLPNRFSDILSKRWENVVKVYHMPYSKFYYDIYDTISAMLDHIQHYFTRMTSDGISYEKRHRFMTVYIIMELVVLILDIESMPFHPRDRRTTEGVRINLSYKNFTDMRETVRTWSESDYALNPGFRFTKLSDYMAVYIDSLETYLAYRQDRATEEAAAVARGVSPNRVYLKKLSVTERLEVFHTIKRTMIPLLNLQYTLNRPEYPLVEARLLGELRKQLNDRKELSMELFLYPWYFIVQPVFHYRTDEPTLARLSPGGIPSVCAERLRGIRKEYKDTDTLRLIGTFCSMLQKEAIEPEYKTYRLRLMEDLKHAHPIYNPMESWEVDETQTIYVENIPRSQALYALFLVWLDHADHLKTPEDFWGYYLNTTFAGEEGVYVGVQQDLLQTCLNQLASLSPPLFAPTEPGSDRWILQRDFRPSAEALAYLNGGTSPDPYYTSKAGLRDFVRFIGGLMTRCLLVGLSWPFKLSFYTLGYLYNAGYKSPNLYAAYYFMDYPQRSAETLGLLKVAPEDFPHLYLNFNTPYPITQEEPTVDLQQLSQQTPPKAITSRRWHHYQAKKRRATLERMRKQLPPSPKNPDITPDNVLEYIRRTARYVLTTLNARDPSVIPESKRRSFKRARAVQTRLLQSFRRGFYIRLEGVSTGELRAVQLCDQMSHQDGLHPEKVREWLISSPPTVVYPVIDLETISEEQRAYLEALRPQQALVAEVFLKDILGNPTVEIPFHRVEGWEKETSGKSPETLRKIKREFFYKSFLPTLLYFWTSARTLISNAPYTIAFQLNDPTQDPHALARLPISHTCFNHLDLPTFYPTMTREGIRKALMERLVIAIYKNVGFGVV